MNTPTDPTNSPNTELGALGPDTALLATELLGQLASVLGRPVGELAAGIAALVYVPTVAEVVDKYLARQCERTRALP